MTEAEMREDIENYCATNKLTLHEGCSRLITMIPKVTLEELKDRSLAEKAWIALQVNNGKQWEEVINVRQPLNQFVKTALKEEFKNKALDGLYEEVITGMTYHSCAIEGNRLTLKEVTDLLYTNCEIITGSVGYRIRDIEDVRGNFDLFRIMLETLDSPLTSNLLKQWHKEYAIGVWTYRDYNYPIGEYRKYYRKVCGHEVCPVDKIAYELEHTLDDYNHSARTLLDIVKLHCKFLVIHPFQGGNGFLARMLTFRECLRNECTPFIIPVESMYEYFSAIDAYAETGDFTPMKDLCDKLQAQFIIMLQQMKQ